MKRMISWLLTLTMVLGMIPGAVFAEEAGLPVEETPVVEDFDQNGELSLLDGTAVASDTGGDEGEPAEGHDGMIALTSDGNGWLMADGVVISNTGVPTADKNKLPAGDYYLAENITIGKTIKILDDVNICLNGKVLQYESTTAGSVFEVAGGALYLSDCGTGYHLYDITNTGLWVWNDDDGEELLYGGAITGGTGRNGDYGGAIYISQGSLEIHDVNLVGNTAAYGGAISGANSYEHTIRIYDSHIVGNVASDDIDADGGAIYARSSNGQIYTNLFISNTQIEENVAVDGGAIAGGGSITLENCTLRKNKASYWGGAIYVSGGSLNLTDCTITKNTAGRTGGAVHTMADMRLSGVVDIRNNSCTAGDDAPNVYLNGANTMVVIAEDFSGNSCIHIKKSMPENQAFTSGGEDYISCFISDDPDYHITDSTGELLFEAHAEITVPGADPTCTIPGLTEGKQCICGKVYVDQVSIPALGHEEEILPGTDATCTETGLTEGKQCSVCGEITAAQEPIPLADHVEEILPGTDATCTADGLTEGKKCSVCGQITEEQEVIPAEGHNWQATDDPGLQKCEICEESQRVYQESGTCGPKLTWTLSYDGVLTVSGTGDMHGYGFSYRPPWYDYRESILQVVLEEGVTGIASYAFEGCKQLTDVTLPETLTSSKDYAFSGCSVLENLYISDAGKWCAVSFANESANPLNCAGNFYVDGQLATNLVIPDGVVQIGNYAFYNCDTAETLSIPGSVRYIGKDAFLRCSKLSSVDIPEGVVSIGTHAFAMGGYTSVTVPSTVTQLSNNAFANCSELREIQVSPDNTAYSSVNGVLLNKEQTVLILAPCGYTGAFEIPETVVTVSDYAFYDCFGLTAITIPNSVTNLGKWTFHNCDSLVRVEIPESVTVLDEAVFDSCNKLESVIIPETVVSIGQLSFYHAESLPQVYLPASIKSVGEDAFLMCDSLIDVYYGGSETDRAAMSIDDGNEDFVDAIWHYLSQPTNGHRVVILPGKAATCTETGLTEGKQCAACGEVLEEQQVLPLADHTEGEAVVENKVAATCKAEGSYETVIYCSVCGEQVSRETVTIPLADHTEEILPGKAPTATEEGLTEGKKCAVCGTITVPQQTIPVNTDLNGDGYHDGDVAAINAIIENNGLNWTKDDPASWKGITWSQESTKRCTHWNVPSNTLVGTLDVTGLTELTYLDCFENPITGLKVTGLVRLEQLFCDYTHITQLDATGLTSLRFLSCIGTELTELHITGLSNLAELWCYDTNLTELDLSGLVNLKGLYCANTGITQLDLSNLLMMENLSANNTPLHTIHVAAGYTVGTASFGETLEFALPTPIREGYTFLGWYTAETGGEAVKTGDAFEQATTLYAHWQNNCTHSWGDAACTEKRTCTLCGEVEAEARGHKEETIPGTAATCTVDGLTEGKKCTVCGETTVEQKPIIAEGHKEETIAGYAATCTVDGLTDGKKCTVCGETTVEQKPITAEGHKEETIPGTAATCTVDGLTEGKKCTVCGETTVAQQPIIAEGHKEETIPGTAATCTVDGLTDGKKCTVCGQTTVEQKPIIAEGHKEETIAGYAATCTAAGLTEGKKCTVCGETTVAQKPSEKLPHTPAAAVREKEVAATCKAEGGYDEVVYCSACGEELSRESKVTEKLPHMEEILPGKAATETEDGLTEGKQCTVCGTVTVPQQTIPASADLNGDGYHDGDVAAINAIIESNGLNWTKDAPREWTGTIWTRNDEGIKRCTRLELARQTMTGTLDVTGLSELKVLSCAMTGITGLKVAGLTKLEELSCFNTAITQLDTTGLSSLINLQCSNTGITVLDVAELTALESLACNNTGITELDVAGLTNLKTLDCVSTGITELDVTALINLEWLYCYNTGITVLDVANLTKLTNLDCSNTGIAELDVAELSELTFLNCANTGITQLDLSQMVNLKTLFAQNTPLRTIEVAAGYTVGTASSGETLEFALPTPIREGYTFLGWYTAETGGEAVETGDAFEQATTLYAHWQNNCTHSWGDAACTEKRTCTLCGEVEAEARGHQEETIPGKAATCTVDGLTEGKKCTVCGETTVEQKPIIAEGHKEEPIPGKAATCTVDGLTEGKKCTVCGETTVEQKPIIAEGHKEETIPGKAATCTVDGLTDGKKCTVCGETTVEQKPITAEGHKEESIPGTAATCTVDGLTEGKKCTVCGETTVEQKPIIAEGHKEETIAGYAATCTVDGLTDGKKCTVCGETTVEQKPITAEGHKEETIPGKAATCTVDGLTEGKKCTVCGETTVEQKPITAEGHKEETIPGTAATCTVDGLTDGKKCTVCGEITVAQQPIEKLPHTPAAAVREKEVAATCKTEGSYDEVVYCSACGEELSRESKVTEKLPHTEEILPGKAATETEDGLTEGKKCTVCGTVTVPQQTIPASADLNGDGYHDGDVAAINAIIENNGLNWTKDAPREWTGTVWTRNDEGIKRCTRLELARQTMTGTLDVTGLSELKVLSCAMTGITGLKVAGLTKLEELSCFNTAITQLDTTGLSSLINLQCSDTGITVLDVAELTALESLACNNTGITELDVAGLTNLKTLDCVSTGITELDVTALINLEWLYCYNTGITVLDVANLTKLTNLDCSNTGIAELDVAELSELTFLNCANTGITQLDLSRMVNLKTLFAQNTSLRTIEVAAGYTVGTASSGETLEFALPTPIREGYTFLGWYTAETGGEPVETGDTFEQATTLYAHWQNNCSHSWGDAACTEKRTCTLCGEVEAEARGHQEETIPGKAAGCTEIGLTEGRQCTVCGELVVMQTAIPATGHAWDNGTVNAQPTCTVNGVKTYVCVHDRTHTRTEVLPVREHNDGNADGQCDTCKLQLSCTVTFDAGGGKPAPQAQITSVGGYLTEPEPPTRKNHGFRGWFRSGDDSRAWDFTRDVVEENMTLVAHWYKNKHQITGNIYQHNGGEPGRPIKLTLMLGNTVIYETQTDKNGFYEMADIPAGIYNLVVEDPDGGIKTVVVEVREDGKMKGIKLPEHNVVSELIVPDEAGNEITVGGLDGVADDHHQGDTRVTVTMTAGKTEDITAEAPETDDKKAQKEAQKAIKEQAKSNNGNGNQPEDTVQEFVFLDIRIEKTEGDQVQEKEEITETSDLLEIRVPVETNGRRAFKVYRHHGEQVDELTEQPNGLGEYIEIHDGFVMIYAKRFSMYAVASEICAHKMSTRYSWSARGCDVIHECALCDDPLVETTETVQFWLEDGALRLSHLPEDLRLLVCGYNGGQLAGSQVLEAPQRSNPLAVEGDVIKLFLLQNDGSWKPLANAKTLK